MNLPVTGVALLALLVSVATASAEPVSCSRFQDAVVKAGGDLAPQFVRPLVVSRGGPTGLDQFDLVSRARIDGVLRCRGETFASFEAKITMPADEGLIASFGKAQEAALAGLGWSAGRAQEKARAMSADAADYLRGSIERGDVSVAGKVEEHQPGGIDLGLIWTKSDRSFVILQNP